MNPKQTFYEHQANTIIANLKKRQMDGFYCPTCKDAVKTAMELVSTGDSVSFGGSMTLSESGIMDALNAREDITLYDRSKASTPEEISTIYRKAFSCDTYFMSTNAITLDGELVNTDGNGNRVAALIFGPAQVIIVCGMNKVATDTDAAIARVRNIASPPNCNRLNRKTPCATTGVCADCLSPECICNHTVITRRCGTPHRIKVLLVGEELGY